MLLLTAIIVLMGGIVDAPSWPRIFATGVALWHGVMLLQNLRPLGGTDGSQVFGNLLTKLCNIRLDRVLAPEQLRGGGRERIAELVIDDIPCVPPGMTIATALETAPSGAAESIFVVAPGGEVEGLTFRSWLLEASPESRSTTAVGSLMLPRSRWPKPRVSSTTEQAAWCMAIVPVDEMPVLGQFGPIGIVRRSDLMAEAAPPADSAA